LRRIQAHYFAVWRDGPSRMGWPGMTYFAVQPRWIRYCDFDQSPAQIEEIRFAE
jgi:hypothetical protein